MEERLIKFKFAIFIVSFFEEKKSGNQSPKITNNPYIASILELELIS